MHDLVLHLQLDRGLGEHGVAAAALRKHDHVQNLERWCVPGLGPPHQQLERTLRRLELVPGVLQILDTRHHRALAADGIHPKLASAQPHIAATRQLGHHDLALISDPFGRDVLVAGRDLLDRGDVRAALVRERGRAHVRRVRARADVGDLADRSRQFRQPRQAIVGHAPPPHLQLQGRDDGDEVGVTAPFPPPVHRSLHLRAAGLHGGQRVGDGQIAVVVGVDAERRGDALAHRGDDLADLTGQAAPVGIAQGEPVGAGLGGGAQHRERVGRIGAIPVEEVFRVVDHLAPFVLQEPHAVGHHGQVLLGGGTEHLDHVQQPGFPEDAHHGRVGVDEGAHVRVLIGLRAGAAGASERRQLGVFQTQLTRTAEELDVLGVGPRIPALDEVNPKAVQEPGNLQLVLDREREALTLRTIAECRVEELNVHGRILSGGCEKEPASLGEARRDLQDIPQNRGLGAGRETLRTRHRGAPGGGSFPAWPNHPAPCPRPSSLKRPRP